MAAAAVSAVEMQCPAAYWQELHRLFAPAGESSREDIATAALPRTCPAGYWNALHERFQRKGTPREPSVPLLPSCPPEYWRTLHCRFPRMSPPQRSREASSASATSRPSRVIVTSPLWLVDPSDDTRHSCENDDTFPTASLEVLARKGGVWGAAAPLPLRPKPGGSSASSSSRRRGPFSAEFPSSGQDHDFKAPDERSELSNQYDVGNLPGVRKGPLAPCAAVRWAQNKTNHTRLEIARLKPLLFELEEDLEFLPPDEKFHVADLRYALTMCASRKNWLPPEDVKILDELMKLFTVSFDFEQGDLVSYDDFMAFVIGTSENGGLMKEVRVKLSRAMNDSIETMQQVMHRFHSWERIPDGLVTKQELQGLIGELLVLSQCTPIDRVALVEEVVNATGVNIDGKVNVLEAVAHFLGRRRTPVELILYDISAGVAKDWSEAVLGTHFDAIYHSGLLVFGSEYWYGGKIFKSKPGSEWRNFGDPLAESTLELQPSSYVAGLRTLHLGHTLCTSKEWTRFVNRRLCKQFTQENYDVLKCNCNRFTNEAIRFLTGEDLPDEIMQLPNRLLNTRVSQLLRPALNRWLGGFRSSMSEVEATEDSCSFSSAAALGRCRSRAMPWCCASTNHVVDVGETKDYEMAV